MLKKHELTDPRSCLNKAAADEPVFVLRAKDPLAAEVVNHWACLAGGVHEAAKVQEAFNCADEMKKWHDANIG